jgi:DNA-directed RNA polymerase specialized sigma subunit
MNRARVAHIAVRASRTPEEELGGREEWEMLLRDAEATEPGARALLILLYQHDLTWKEAAERLGIDERRAQRIEEKVFPRLRALTVGRRQRA